MESSFFCNSVVWITSLDDNDLGISRRITEDISTYLTTQNILGFSKIRVNCRSELVDALEEINALAKERGLCPILVFDMHGNQNSLVLSNPEETMSWDELIVLLRKINISTQNNLCVIGAACFSLYAILKITIKEAVPFFILLAPPKKVANGFLIDNLPKFFEHLSKTLDFSEAYKCHLSGVFEYFHCEKTLILAMKRYIEQNCRSKSAMKRREKIMTKIFDLGIENTKINRKLFRGKLKQYLKPDQALLDRFAPTFLVGKPYNFKMKDILNHLYAKP